jgi:hypothetical protein
LRRDAEFFGDQEMSLVLVAKRLKEALKAEDLLTAAGLDYAVETDTYSGGIIFRSERVGAFVYVRPEDEENARGVLTQGGVKPFEG